MIYTTLRLCRDNKACKSGYDALVASLPDGHGDDDPISLVHILTKSRGVDDAVWALRAATDQPSADRIARLFACDCAERVLPLFEATRPDDKRPRTAVKTARRFANGEATQRGLDAARAAAWDAARDAARDATRAVAWASALTAAGAAARDVALAAARALAWDAVGVAEWQRQRLQELLNGASGQAIEQEISE